MSSMPIAATPVRERCDTTNLRTFQTLTVITLISVGFWALIAATIVQT